MPTTHKVYNASSHVRTHMTEAADEGALFVRKLLRGEIPADEGNLALATQARAAISAFTRYEATLSSRDQTSVIVSKMLAGDDPGEFQRYIKASLPEHAAVRVIDLRLEPGEQAAS